MSTTITVHLSPHVKPLVGVRRRSVPYCSGVCPSYTPTPGSEAPGACNLCKEPMPSGAVCIPAIEAAGIQWKGKRHG